jgi:ubiquinone/menaquinone biosynthesis C-methylase UbiE
LDLIESVLPLSDKSVLDVGCGPGLFTHHLAQRARKVMGCDSSAHMLQAIAGVEALEADATCLPFKDQSFDVVFEANLLHHTQEPQRVVAQMARVAKEAVVLIEVNALNPIMFAFSALNRAERGGLRSTPWHLRSLLDQAGLVVERFWTTGMISQNNTPGLLVPFLKMFDVDFFLGEYHVVVAIKTQRVPVGTDVAIWELG